MYTRTVAFLESRSNSDLKRSVALEVNRLFAVYRRETGAEPMAGGSQNIIQQIEQQQQDDAYANSGTGTGHGLSQKKKSRGGGTVQPWTPAADTDLFQFSLDDCGKTKRRCAAFAQLPDDAYANSGTGTGHGLSQKKKSRGGGTMQPWTPAADTDLFQFSLDDCGKTKRRCAAFAQLPVWVRLRVFARLDADDLRACAAVCRQWYVLAGDELIWRRLLADAARRWRRVRHDRNPHFYRQACPDMSSKEIYLRCLPNAAVDDIDNSGGSAMVGGLVGGLGGGIGSLLREHVLAHPRLVMFGPGLESDTSRVVRSILTDQHVTALQTANKFVVTGMVPGQFAGIGSGISIRLGESAFNLVTLYSNVKSIRKNLSGENRVTENKLFVRQPDSTSPSSRQQPVYEVSPAVQELCRRSHGFIFVVDTSQSLEEIALAQTELFAMLCEMWACPAAPLLVLACESPSAAIAPHRHSPVDVVSALRLGRLSNRKWLVQHGDVESLKGVRDGFQWALSQIGYSSLLTTSLR